MTLQSSGEFAQVVAQFVAAWETGGRPRIQDFVVLIEPPQRADLVQRLLGVEIQERTRRGENPTRWDYYPVLPHFRAAIDRAFIPPEQQATQQHRAETRSPSPAASECADDSTPALLGRVGRYRLESRLGSGGFGDVYVGVDEELERRVAVKLLRARAANWEALIKEARLAASLNHPAIVAVYDVGRAENGAGFIVMEYIPGGPFDDALKAERMDLPAIVEAAATAAEALHYAHKRGLVHRDLKPANILMDDELRPHVSDFGLAVHEAWQHQRAGEVAGSPQYMAPEQIRGETHRLDGRTDIWALGVILYEAMTGRKPFQGRTRRELLDEICSRDPKPPRMIRDGLPAALEQICLKCLAKPVTGRYSTAADLAAELRAALAPARTPPAPSDPTAGILHMMWDCLDESLQDAFSLAYNQKRRTGGNRISTRDLFQALVRIDDEAFHALAASLPEGALPEPLAPDVASDDSVLQEEPLLSNCVADSLTAFQQLAPLPRKVSPADIFVDIAKHGHGPSVSRLRQHGVGPAEVDTRVSQLKLPVQKRRTK